MCKKCKCKPKAVKVIRVGKDDFDYDKLAEAIVSAQKKSNKNIKWYNILDKAFICLFALLGFVLLILGMLCMRINAHKGASLVMLSIFISTVPIFTHLASKVEETSVKISLVVAVISVISFIKDFLIAMYF